MDHQYYKKNKKYFENRLKSIDPELLDFELRYQERLKIDVRKPSGLKIDGYLENYKELRYNYDYGDNWWFTIKLEEIVEDYYFGFPTLLDGAEDAPPEDVGGIGGFYDFLEAYHNPDHPEHEEMKAWAEGMFFRTYDFKWINESLKALDYKKTQWDKIKHERYVVLEDRYRK